jgi:single-strand DNA-binding protein
MANFNKIILIGNLTRDPQLKYLPSQMSVTEFGLAVNHKYRTKTGEEREEVCFIECTCFGKGGEIINQYCTKGRPLLVEGRLKFDTWEDKQGGGKRSKHSVFVENFQLLGGRDGPPGGGGGGGAAGGYSSGGNNSYGGGAPVYEGDPAPDDQRSAPPARPAPQRPPAARAPAPPSRPAPSAPAEAPYGEEQQFKEDDIPF